MSGLFGTDGVRGVVNEGLTPELALSLGLGAAEVLAGEEGGRFLVGRDTRDSGPMLELALTSGLASGGADVDLVGVITTPGLAYLVEATGASGGAMISASHNPAHYNGIKFFDGSGIKLDEAAEARIARLVEARVARRARPGALGRIRVRGGLGEPYLDHLASCAGPVPMGLRAVVDCAHGSASSFAPTLMERVGVEARVINASPDGDNINLDSGSLHLSGLAETVTRTGADLGLAFDGDADRVLAVDEKGREVDGDHIMAISGLDLLSHDRLPGGLVVATVMSNLGLELCLAGAGGRLVRTAVGDRYVHAEMVRRGATLGGEQSGHIIFSSLGTTGDGMLTALQLMSVMVRSGRPLSELRECMQVMPQVLLNVEVRTRDGWEDAPGIRRAVEEARGRLGDSGRVLIRPSGTEPVIRVMMEGPDRSALEELAREVAGEVSRALGCEGGDDREKGT